MKLNKKFLACFMAATMAIAPMTAFGDGASTTINGQGTVSVPTTEVYNVILPTDKGISFKVDPYGLLDIDGSKTLEQVLSAPGGTVTSAATAIINKSSMDINVKVSSHVTTSTTSSLTLAGSEQDARDGKADLYLAIAQYKGATIDATTIVTSAAASVSGDTDVSSHVYVLSSASIDVSGAALDTASASAITALTDSAASVSVLNLKLEDMASAYEVLSDGSVTLSEGAVQCTDENSYVFRIYGYADPESDVWESLKDETINLTMKFDISAGEAAAAGPINVTSVSKTNNSFTYTLPEGATKIASIVGTKVAGGTVTLKSGDHYTSSGNTITITNQTLLTPTTYSKITVTFNDSPATVVDLTVVE